MNCSLLFHQCKEKELHTYARSLRDSVEGLHVFLFLLFLRSATTRSDLLCIRHALCRNAKHTATLYLTLGEVYLRRSHIRPDRPAPFPDVVCPPSVRHEAEDVVVEALRRVVPWDAHVDVLQVLEAAAPVRVPGRLEQGLFRQIPQKVVRGSR